MPINPNACQSKQECRCHQLGQDHTVLRFWGRKSILNSSQVSVRDIPWDPRRWHSPKAKPGSG